MIPTSYPDSTEMARLTALEPPEGPGLPNPLRRKRIGPTPTNGLPRRPRTSC